MNLQLEGKTALVTGSAAGIGLAIATALAKEGARVIVNGRTKETLLKKISRHGAWSS
jgi:NAD(P)-dependent dehydrogenase (short-subunit alcohol dehydrogenase family)